MYAVIDTETTGLSLTSDRIIELAVIGLDASGNQEWEWCSLINPERDTGPGLAVRVHQIYPRDVSEAPTFAEFAGHIARILSGRVLIGHNIKFDLGMLAAEFERLGHPLPELIQICTAAIARESGFRPYRLEACCEVLGIELSGAHHALADARATADLAQRLVNFSDLLAQSDVVHRPRTVRPWPNIPVVSREPVVRAIPPSRKSSPLHTNRMSPVRKAQVDLPTCEPKAPVVETFSLDRESPESKYLAAIEWALEDREISTEQKQALTDLRCELRLSDEQARAVHMLFIRGLAGSMWADGSISAHEQFDLNVVGAALHLTAEDVEYARDNPIGLGLTNQDYVISPGATVVFTGEMSLSRTEWTDRAQAAGLRVTGSVSRKTDFLVVPFGETGSTKSRKARGLGVRVVSEQRFRRMLGAVENNGGSKNDPFPQSKDTQYIAPETSETEAILREAIETGEVLTIAYHGGSKPGSKREIAPICIEDDLVRARCYSSGKVKDFRIEQIQVFENDLLISRWNPEEVGKRIRTYEDLSGVLEDKAGELTSMGWYVTGEEDGIFLFRRFKNGRLLKRPDVSIQYVETIDEGYFDPGMNYHAEIRKRARPWIISLRQGGTAFGRLDRAVERFMLEALKHAPS